MIIYNLFPLLAGPFSGWPKHFSRIAAMGFDWVFVNPIQRLGASRSLYSIVDPFSFNPALLDPTSTASVEEPDGSRCRSRCIGLFRAGACRGTQPGPVRFRGPGCGLFARCCAAGHTRRKVRCLCHPEQDAWEETSRTLLVLGQG